MTIGELHSILFPDFDRGNGSSSKRYKILDERNTDLEVILRGFAKELLAFLECSEKSGYPLFKEDGLSIREVRALISIQGEEK